VPTGSVLFVITIGIVRVSPGRRDRPIGGRDDHVDLPFHQLSGQLRKFFRLVIGIASFENERLALVVTKLTHSLLECLDQHYDASGIGSAE